MRLQKLFGPLLAAGAALATVGCAGESRRHVVTTVPSPRHEVVVYRPGHLWVHGHWRHDGRRWVWRDGYHVRERPNHVYVQGYWERRNGRFVWVNGGWRARGRVVFR